MKYIVLFYTICLAASFLSGCRPKAETNQKVEQVVETPSPTSVRQSTASPTPAVPNLQAELLDAPDKITSSPIGQFDFKNYTYPLPHGWENPDGSDIKLVNGRVAPVGAISNSGDLNDEAKADLKARRRIGMSYVTTKFIDVTGDGQDEAVVVLKIETAGSAIPQIVYIFEWKNGEPELIWSFRTGDRADGGLKNVRVENGSFTVELYGQDRFLLGQMETGKITGDIEQLCCPKYFTRSFYKWNGKSFAMQGKRLTYPLADPHTAPVENLGDKVNAPTKSKR